jgi:putative protease
MKLAVTPFNLSSIKQLSQSGADVFILGNEDYANRLVNSFSLIELQEAKQIISKLGKEMYLNMNLIIHHSQIDSFRSFLEFAKELEVDGVIIGDIGGYMLAKEVGIESKIIYNPETLNTNYYDTVFWNKKGIKGITVSKEITLHDMMEICEKKELEISIIGHGHLSMFHSRRPLIENFFKYTKEEYDRFMENRNLKIVEEIRNEAYPIFQDAHGTHIFREKPLQSYTEVLEFSKCIDVFIIDGIFKDTAYLNEVVSNYHSILNKDSMKLAEKISKIYSKDHDSGFLFKKTQYDKF